MRISDWSSDVCSSDLHGVEVRPIDINASFWDNSLERKGDGSLALRIGFSQMDGFREDWAKALAVARANGTFDSMEALARRAELPGRALRSVADADACRSMGVDMGGGIWEGGRYAE